MLREPGEESYDGSEPNERTPILKPTEAQRREEKPNSEDQMPGLEAQNRLEEKPNSEEQMPDLEAQKRLDEELNSELNVRKPLDDRPDSELESNLEPCEEVKCDVDDSTVQNDMDELDRLELKQKIMEIVSNLPLKPPMNHSDTKDSLSSVDSFQLKEEDAHHADLSDSASDDANRKKVVKNDDEETEFVPPDEELAQKIVDQVEFYFSDVNITKDAFLLKHVKRNKEGYVSLKLISSFKRVKHLAKDWRVVAFALAKSKKLEINEAGTKLRRVDPLPAYDQTTPSRTVVAVDLPLEKPTIENVAEMFKSCGEIALIRILRPGNPIPADVRHFVNKHPEMIGKISALVEFVRTESAHNAIQKEWNWRQEEKMKVIELNAPPSMDSKKKRTKKMLRSLEMEYSSSCQSGSEAEDRRMRLQRRCSSPQLTHGEHWMARRWSRDSGTDSSSSYSTRSRSNSGVFYMPDHVRRMSSDSCSDSHGSRSRSNSGISLSDIRRLSIVSKDSDCCCCHADCSRRGSSGSEGYGSARSRCNSGASDVRRNSIEFYCAGKARERRFPEHNYYDNGRRHDNKPRANGDNVVRMPRGPDGGRGFIPAPAPCHTLIE